jgi:glucose-1-phosphate thymidylyltransferase
VGSLGDIGSSFREVLFKDLPIYSGGMKALVLAGGFGTRMRPMTHTSAKQLLPVANKPVLFYILESIAAAGIKDVGIVIGETGAQITSAVGDGSAFGLNVTYIPQPKPLGLAHAVVISQDWLGDDDFLMYLGDNFLSDGVATYVQNFQDRRSDAWILLTHSDDPQSFGVADLDGEGRVVGLEEKPEFPKSDLILVGLYMFTPLVHEAIRHISPSRRGELEITDAVQWLIESRYDVGAEVLTGYWKDTGSVSDILDVNRLLLERLGTRVEGDVDEASEIVGQVEIGPGAKVRNSRIVGPAAIMAGTEISESSVGPFTSIGENCHISGSEIEFSIVLPESTIHGVQRVEKSFIGRNAEVAAPTPAHGVYQFVLGDHSRMRIGQS